MKNIIKAVFAKLGIRITRYSPTGNFTLNRKRVKKFLYLKRMLDRVSGADGAVVECGVGRAGSFRMLALLLQEEGRSRALWGFDSFEGYPEPANEDAGTRNPKKGEGAKMSVDELWQALSDLRIEVPVRIVKGFFEESLPKTEVPPIALLHLDVNLYSAYKTCLERLFPKVVVGGVVLFDEYAEASRKWPGAKKAIDEYFTGTKYRIQQDPFCNKNFLVKDQ